VFAALAAQELFTIARFLIERNYMPAVTDERLQADCVRVLMNR